MCLLQNIILPVHSKDIETNKSQSKVTFYSRDTSVIHTTKLFSKFQSVGVGKTKN